MILSDGGYAVVSAEQALANQLEQMARMRGRVAEANAFYAAQNAYSQAQETAAPTVTAQAQPAYDGTIVESQTRVISANKRAATTDAETPAPDNSKMWALLLTLALAAFNG